MRTTTPAHAASGPGPADGSHRPTQPTVPLAALAAGTWAATYLVLGVLWALGGPGYPFAAADGVAPATGLLDQTTPLVSGLTMATFAVVTGVLTLRLVRGRTDRTTTVLAVVTGLVLAVVLTDVRILMSIGYLPVMLVALAAGQIEVDTITAMVSWPSINLLILMVAGISLATLGGRPLLERAREMDPGRLYRIGQVAVAVAMAVPVGYAVVRLGWLLGIPVGISPEFLASIAAITPIGAGLACFGLLGAVLTLGLVRPWGEVWPRWVPVLRGRPVPPRLPAYAALAVAVPIASAGLMYVRRMIAGAEIGPPGAAAEPGAWLPEMFWPLWALALTVAGLAYLLRRSHGLYLSRWHG